MKVGKRSRYHKLPYRIYRLDYGDGYPMGYSNWDLKESLSAALRLFPEAPDKENVEAWEYIQIVPMQSYLKYGVGNDGTQAWRHKESGYTIPDYCRQLGGCPECWQTSKCRQLEIHKDSPVFSHIFRSPHEQAHSHRGH